jgi:CPA1 family monovalent cation:H+ antiporter
MDHVNYILVLLIGLLCAVAAVAGLARRFAVSYPIVLVVFGLLCSLLPHVPRIPLPPSVVFLVILPPLLYIAAWQTSRREFRYNLVSISSLAKFLVFFTAFGVAFAAQCWLPGFNWQLGFLLERYYGCCIPYPQCRNQAAAFSGVMVLRASVTA